MLSSIYQLFQASGLQRILWLGSDFEVDAVFLINVANVVPDENDRRKIVKECTKRLRAGGWFLWMSQYGEPHYKPGVTKRLRAPDGRWFYSLDKEQQTYYREFTIPEIMSYFNTGQYRELRKLNAAHHRSKYIQTFLPVVSGTLPQNGVMSFTDSTGNPTISVTAPGQELKILLKHVPNVLLKQPFSVLTERVDLVDHVISAVTMKGHPLAGWRYWRVYSIGANDVVIETGAYDQPGPGPANYIGYFLAKGEVSRGWYEYLQWIQRDLHAQTGTNLRNTLGGIKVSPFWMTLEGTTLHKGYWDVPGDFTNYILNNVCQSTSCN
ncbi:MAG: hypothetical protein WCC22_09220 [Terriglobales bacterium]